MTTDVNKAIQELLFEKTAVIVPGLGGFTSTPGTATVDYVQDVITPPASKLDFNPNLVLNDGVLVQYLQKHNLSTYQEAEGMVERYVSSVRDTLERREIFEIPKVGRLYQDYEQKIRFMPEGTNFNADSFGLPIVNFQPLVKEKPKVVAPPKPVPAEALFEPAEVAAIKVDESSASMTMKILPWAVLLLAILIALLLYNIFGGSKQKPVAELPEAIERLNVKPTLPEAGTSETSPKEQPPVVANPPKEAAVPDAADTEQDSFEPTKNKLYLVVHSFGMKGNATKFAQTLTEDGYGAQTKKAGNLYRVGVTFAYSTQSDIEKMRKELAAKYKAGPKTEKELEEMGQ
ncbi:MAG: SPOR domain-containing protein [Saprospiraceae bacterium]|nr:SPOR domain-containing protein [Saprospiraceae bacterium]MCF8252570.1 SPOR domain-containing protein [Saprospiraceae bacterium]MCF8282611.1 SPOR domain-containing protein [Bacteroidales bacterium]MCF8314142.1 SPOR domain-containing protein [Saprospiraceae bacterium]MCF8442922.1 SPOR domain-containing protein [Saprospiraceae bacterium]